MEEPENKDVCPHKFITENISPNAEFTHFAGVEFAQTRASSRKIE
jgi:hypothetical protein